MSNYFFLSIICSKLCAFHIKSVNINLDRAVFPKINTQTLNSFPVPAISRLNEKVISALTNHGMEAQIIRSKLATTKTDSEKDYLEKRCSIIDRQIDRLVYEIYGLTEEEIAIVENSK